MSELTGWTKAELVNYVSRLETETETKNSEISDLKQKLQDSLSSETGAMKRCVIALNALTVTEPAGYRNGSYRDASTVPNKDAVARALRYLHDRFDV